MKFLATIAFFVIGFTAVAQQTPLYNNYQINPVLLNPSYNGASGYTELSVNYRRQWAGIEGAPSTVNAILQLPVNKKISLGARLFSDKRGVLNTYESALNFSYHLPVNKDISVGFGLLMGAGRNDIDFQGSDQAVDRALDNSWYATGSFGMNVQLKNLKLGFAFPELFERDLLDQENFEELGLDATSQTISSISYNIEIAPLWTIEPMVIYRTDRIGDSQIEGAALLRYKDIGWIGASYREEHGAGANVGFSINERLKFAYAFEFASQMTNGFGDGSHELQLILRLGNRNKKVKNNTIISENVNNATSLPEAAEVEDQEAAIASVEPEEEPVEQRTPKKKETIAANVPETTTAPDVASNESVEEDITPVNIKLNKSEGNKGDLIPGYYVVVGAFRIADNADKYALAVDKKGFASEKAYSPETGFTYVFIMRTESQSQAKESTRSIQKLKTLYFPEAWVLHVED